MRRWDRARDYLAGGQAAPAQAQLESLQLLAPDDAHTHLLAAWIAWQQDQPRVAAGRALAAVETAVEHCDAAGLCDAIDTLLTTGESAAAHALLEHPAWEQTDSTDTLLRYANYLQDFGDPGRALTILDRLAPACGRDGPYHFYRGQQLTFLGRLDAAADAFERCLTLAPGYGRAAYRLVRLHQPDRARHQLSLVDRGLRDTAPGSWMHAAFAFARYHLMEDAGDFEQAWEMLVLGNAEMRALTRRDAARQQALDVRLCEWSMTHAPDHRVPVLGSPVPVFIVGMPRSGTTLLQQLLSNHSQVVAAGELTDFGQQLVWCTDTKDTHSEQFLSRLAELDPGELGRRYLTQAAWRARGRTRFVDKLPANWLMVGLIHAALPQAKILHLVRDPMDVCFSSFRTLFSDACAWSFDFDAIAAHYRVYRRMLAHWHVMLPGVVLDVSYADLVGHAQTTLRKTLGFCGLDWEPGCEDVSGNATPVLSLSAAQVREPVHSRSIDQWKRYAQQLEPLREKLLPVA